MKLLKTLLILALFISAAAAQPQLPSGNGDFWQTEKMPAPPVRLEGAFWGLDGGNIIAVGGEVLEDDSRRANLDIYVFFKDSSSWQIAGEIETPIIGGAAVSTSRGLVTIGGKSEGEISTQVSRYRISGDTVEIHSLPALPFEVVSPKADVLSGHIYLAAYSPEAQEGKVFLRFDLLSRAASWQSVTPWDGAARVDMSVASVANKFFVFGGIGAEGSQLAGETLYDVYEYRRNEGWREVTELPFSAVGAITAACGEAHILFTNIEGSQQEMFGFYSVTSRYLKFEGASLQSTPIAMVSDDTDVYIITADELTYLSAVLPGTKYGFADHSVVFIFMIGMLCVGSYLAKRERSSEDYFRGGRRVPWWAAGLSMFATGASAISLMAMPGMSFATNWVYMTISFYVVITILPISLYLYMPIARRLRVATANEYLERRYNLYMRLLASAIWSLLQMLGRMSAIMLLPAIALSSIVGMPIEVSILIMGVITTIYVFLGGLEGVIWTDVLQAAVMIFAVAVCAIWAIVSLNMSASDAFTQLQAADKLHMFDWNIDFTRATVLIVFLNVLVTSFGMIGDQNYIQRVQCTSSEREAKKAIVTQLAVAVPLNFVLFSLGTILFLYYMERPDMLSPATKSDGVFPLFAAQNLPIGLAGLVVAAILAATMSTLSSALNSTANIGVEDFYRRLFKSATDRKCVILGKALTAGLGIFGTVSALILANTRLMSIWDLYLTILGMLMGAITGVFVLGIFTKKANSPGAILGAIASLVATIYAEKYTHIHFFMYPAIGVGACLVVGYISSIIIPAEKKDLTGLTAYTLGKRIED